MEREGDIQGGVEDSKQVGRDAKMEGEEEGEYSQMGRKEKKRVLIIVDSAGMEKKKEEEK